MSLPVVVSHAGRNERLGGHMVNLDWGGASVLLGRAPSEGADVGLVVDSPNRWDPLEIPARVVWFKTEKEGLIRVGLRFDETPPETTLDLLDLLAPDRFD